MIPESKLEPDFHLKELATLPNQSDDNRCGVLRDKYPISSPTFSSPPPARSRIFNIWCKMHIAFIVISVFTYITAALYIHVNPYELSAAYYYYVSMEGFTENIPRAKSWSGLMILSAVWMTIVMTLLFLYGRWTITRRSTEKCLAGFLGALVMTISACLLMTIIFGFFNIRAFFGWNNDYEYESQMLRWGKDNHNIRIASLAFGWLFFVISVIYAHFTYTACKCRESLIDGGLVEKYDEWEFLDDDEIMIVPPTDTHTLC